MNFCPFMIKTNFGVDFGTKWISLPHIGRTWYISGRKSDFKMRFLSKLVEISFGVVLSFQKMNFILFRIIFEKIFFDNFQLFWSLLRVYYVV